MKAYITDICWSPPDTVRLTVMTTSQDIKKYMTDAGFKTLVESPVSIIFPGELRAETEKAYLTDLYEQARAEGYRAGIEAAAKEAEDHRRGYMFHSYEWWACNGILIRIRDLATLDGDELTAEEWDAAAAEARAALEEP